LKGQNSNGLNPKRMQSFHHNFSLTTCCAASLIENLQSKLYSITS
jgi:hypothetical protein